MIYYSTANHHSSNIVNVWLKYSHIYAERVYHVVHVVMDVTESTV